MPEVARNIAGIMQEGIINFRGRKRKPAEDPSYCSAKLRRQRSGRLASISEQKPEFDKVLEGSTNLPNKYLLEFLLLFYDYLSQDSGCGEEGKDVLSAGVLATMASKALAASSKEPLCYVLSELILYIESMFSKMIFFISTK